MFRFQNVNHIWETSRAGAASCYIGDDAVLCRVLGEFKMYTISDDLSLSPHLIMDGCWEPWITRLVSNLVLPGMRVVNVGAHVGYYTLLAAHQAGPQGRVLAVEANPNLAHCIYRNAQVNGKDHQVVVDVSAAWDRPGQTIDLVTPDKNLTGSSWCEETHARATDNKAINQVKSSTIDDLVRQYELGTPDFLIIDAEGSEPRILRGAPDTLANPGIQILMEWMGDREDYGQDFYDWLTKGHRFRLYYVNHKGQPELCNGPPQVPVGNVYLKRPLEVIREMASERNDDPDRAEG